MLYASTHITQEYLYCNLFFSYCLLKMGSGEKKSIN